jgi:hypothetical protein
MHGLFSSNRDEPIPKVVEEVRKVPIVVPSPEEDLSGDELTDRRLEQVGVTHRERKSVLRCVFAVVHTLHHSSLLAGSPVEH